MYINNLISLSTDSEFRKKLSYDDIENKITDNISNENTLQLITLQIIVIYII